MKNNNLLDLLLRLIASHGMWPGFLFSAPTPACTAYSQPRAAATHAGFIKTTIYKVQSINQFKYN